jgi:hypothetical protein
MLEMSVKERSVVYFFSRQGAGQLILEIGNLAGMIKRREHRFTMYPRNEEENVKEVDYVIKYCGIFSSEVTFVGSLLFEFVISGTSGFTISIPGASHLDFGDLL